MNLPATIVPESLTDPGDSLVTAFADVQNTLEKVLRSLLGNLEDAEDALQIAFLRCWQARAAVPHIRNLRGWIWRISLNVGRDLLDYTRRRRARPLAEAEEMLFCTTISPLDALVEQEDDERLHVALGDLRPEENEVFLLRQNQSLTYEEIARLRGCPVGSVKTLMHAAVHKLRAKLQKKM